MLIVKIYRKCGVLMCRVSQVIHVQVKRGMKGVLVEYKLYISTTRHVNMQYKLNYMY